MMYLSGARGINADFISPLSFKGRANNPLQADAEHMVCGGSTTIANLTANDKMSLGIVEKLVARPNPRPMMQPITVEANASVCSSHVQAFSLRVRLPDDWLDIPKAAGVRGDGSRVYKNALGSMPTSSCTTQAIATWNSGNVGAAALFLGAQAGLAASAGRPGRTAAVERRKRMTAATRSPLLRGPSLA
ncbi:MAG: hypothetical protein ACLSTO_12160 [Bilophila wadsworthia]